MSMKKISLVAVILSLIATSIFSFGAQAAPEAKSVYIVKFKDNVSLEKEIFATRSNGVSISKVLEHAFKGFIGEMTSAQATALSRNPRIDFIEADQQVFLEATANSWGQDRVDQIGFPLDNEYKSVTTGFGVTAYVIDSGIKTHDEFGTRLKVGYSALSTDSSTQDCNGHGTHVAGTIGGSTYGLANGVDLVPVRVFGCTGGSSWSVIISGINWVIGNHGDNVKAVANLSLGGPASTAMDTAIKNLSADGVVVVVAAGNENRDACKFSPARVAQAITVGATGTGVNGVISSPNGYDTRATYSNFGSCLDIFAPGTYIRSSWFTAIDAIATLSGTSMAAPHVAGIAARILEGYRDYSPRTHVLNIATLITGQGQSKVLNAGRNSTTKLLYMAPTS